MRTGGQPQLFPSKRSVPAFLGPHNAEMNSTRSSLHSPKSSQWDLRGTIASKCQGSSGIVPGPLIWIRFSPEPIFVASSWGKMVAIKDLDKQLFLL